LPKSSTSTLPETEDEFEALKVNTLGTGAEPAAELGVALGVMVTVQEAAGFRVAPQVLMAVVPTGQVG
jgi:hypothetical protein